jgi:hypothetical protein
VALDQQGRPGFPTPVARRAVTAGADFAARHVVLRPAAVSGRPVQLRVRTGTGSAGAEDHHPFRVRVTVPAARRSTTVPVTILPDADDEPDETFVVRITRATRARVVEPDAR